MGCIINAPNSSLVGPVLLYLVLVPDLCATQPYPGAGQQTVEVADAPLRLGTVNQPVLHWHKGQLIPGGANISVRPGPSTDTRGYHPPGPLVLNNNYGEGPD